ncbi:MAG: hypothetical protein K0S75_1666 [Clostridia bacterium]|jgi:hypothetical protein|nr:hypothetical protein [Clostridia bacterium]
MSTCDFTYSHYEKILELVKKAEYKVTFFNEAYQHEKEFILRHDIDMDLEKAYRMALLENKHNIKTTYFILIRSPFYNIFDKFNSDLIKGILDLDHQIGLHFDEAFYGLNDVESIIKKVDSEVQILEDYFDTKIFAVSFHRPSQFLLQSNIKLKNNLINTYELDFTKEFKYISDSRRTWREGCMCRFLEKSDANYHSPDRIQSLVHPIWWTDKSQSAQDIIEGFLLKKFSYLDGELVKNIQIYKSLL